MAAAWLLFLLLGLVSGSLGNGLSILLVFVDSPVKDVVILERLTHEQVPEDLAKVGIIRLVVKAKRASVVEVDGKLVGEAAAQDLSGSCHLLLHDSIVLLLLGSRLQSLPRKRTTTEVEHHIAQGLHIITTRLFDTKMCVDTGISSGTSQVFVLTVWNVEVSLWVAVLLGKTEINDVDLIPTFPDAHEEVVRLDVAVNEGLGVDVFDAGDELIGKEEDGLQGEFAVAKVEEILQTRPQQVENHGVVVTFGSKPADERDSHTTSQRFVDTGLIFELRMLGLD